MQRKDVMHCLAAKAAQTATRKHSLKSSAIIGRAWHREARKRETGDVQSTQIQSVYKKSHQFVRQGQL